MDGSLDFENVLNGLIEVARREFGETEYTYHRVAHTWRGTRRNGSYYSSAASNSPVITKEEYDAKMESGKQDARDAFFGKRTGMYYDTYERVISREGWREILLKIIKERDD